MKKLLTIAIIIIAILIGSVLWYFEENPKIVQKNSTANFITYESLKEFEEQSDLIVIAKTNEDFNERTQMKEYGKDIDGEIIEDLIYEWTETDMIVHKVIKNNEEKIQKGDKIIVNEAFSYKIGRVITDFQYIPLEKNSKYLLFLQKEPKENVYSTINLNNGKYKLTGKDNVKNEIHEKIKNEALKKYKEEIKE